MLKQRRRPMAPRTGRPMVRAKKVVAVVVAVAVAAAAMASASPVMVNRRKPVASRLKQLA